ncbi:redoxin domain-containing protein [Cryobacterium aureum]|uniref:redoxin domain-containing protein n=1 Tax=Cryobacterium aureum TaxID=995037 RepID=UPI00196A70BA|nr:redoxin domain-containing protein [Cryobacterium aureum]
MTFAVMQEEFAQYNTDLVGLSVDGLYSHIAWLRTIEQKISYRGHSNVLVTFPLIDDHTVEVSMKYGMIMPGEGGSSTVRAVFIIDPKGIIRTIIYYPLSTGRNFPELLRVIKALQTADEFGVATPPTGCRANPSLCRCPARAERPRSVWTVPPKKNSPARTGYFCTKKLTEAEIDSRLKV